MHRDAKLLPKLYTTVSFQDYPFNKNNNHNPRSCTSQLGQTLLQALNILHFLQFQCENSTGVQREQEIAGGTIKLAFSLIMMIHDVETFNVYLRQLSLASSRLDQRA